MDEKKFETIVEKLELIIRLLAHQVSLAHGTLEMKAQVLTFLGFKPKDIANICGTTPGTVSVRLAEAKKKGRNKRMKG